MLTPFPRQQEAIDKMVELVKKNSFALNTSGLGSGKTLQAIETCKILGKAPVVVAPASTLTAWERALDEQEVDYYEVLSWDKARTGKRNGTPGIREQGTEGGESPATEF